MLREATTAVARQRVGRRDDAAARDSLRAQITRLERRLCALEPDLVSPARRPRGPHLLGFAELERTRDGLLARLRDAEQTAARRADEQAAARARVEAMLADPSAHRWEQVTRDELGVPGCGDYHVRPRAGLLGMLFGWWCVKLSSGCP